MAEKYTVQYFMPGGPLMHLSVATKRYTLIGTVFGGGYNCITDKVDRFEGSDDGIWNMVSAHVGWINKIISELNTKCMDSDT